MSPQRKADTRPHEATSRHWGNKGKHFKQCTPHFDSSHSHFTTDDPQRPAGAQMPSSQPSVLTHQRTGDKALETSQHSETTRQTRANAQITSKAHTGRPPPEPPPQVRPPPEPPPTTMSSMRPSPFGTTPRATMLTRQDSDSSMTDPPDLISRSEDWEIANSTPGAEQGMHQHLVTPAPTEGLESPPREGDPSGLPSAVDIANNPPTPLWLTRRKHHGDIMEPEKDDRHVRLVLQNLMRLPVMKQADRSTQFLAALRDINPDGVLMSDVGIQWANLMIEHSWIERTTGVLAPHRFRFSCNSHENTGTQVQWGGTGLLCMGEFRSRTHGNMSQDTHNLGRWTSARIQGRHDFFLRVVSAYKPCKNTSDMGSSYQQQLRYFRSINDMRCP